MRTPLRRGLAPLVILLVAGFVSSNARAADFNPPTRERLRALVRPSAVVKSADGFYQAKGNYPAVPLVGDLWMMCGVDEERSIGYLHPKDLPSLGLTGKQALDLCKANVGAVLPPLTPFKQDFHKPGINILGGNPAYTASMFLFPERWAEEAKKSRGRLLVTVIGPNVVLYRGSTSAKAKKELVSAAEIVIPHIPKPFKIEVFRWTKEGWAETD